MTARRISGPIDEPITLAEAKAHLRLRTADQDGNVVSAIRAARDAVERATERALITQTWERRVPVREPGLCCGITLPWPPTQAIVEVTIERPGIPAVVVAGGLYALDASDEPGRVVWTSPAPLTDLGVDTPGPGWVVVRYTAGYGDAADDVPPLLVQAVRYYMAQYFLHRSPSEVLPVSQRVGEMTVVTVTEIIDKFKVVTA